MTATPMPALEHLRDAEAAYRAASTLAEEKREERNHALGEALRAGHTHTQISETTGLTRGRVAQLAQLAAPEMGRAMTRAE